MKIDKDVFWGGVIIALVVIFGLVILAFSEGFLIKELEADLSKANSNIAIIMGQEQGREASYQATINNLQKSLDIANKQIATDQETINDLRARLRCRCWVIPAPEPHWVYIYPYRLNVPCGLTR